MSKQTANARTHARARRDLREPVDDEITVILKIDARVSREEPAKCVERNRVR